jgi:hypothetical protein
VCEGVVTEVAYFEGLRDHLRAIPVDLAKCDIDGVGRDPLSVVKEAVRRRDAARAVARRAGDSFLAYDEVWAVVDVDDHARLEAALSEARRSGINLVVSSPCFEIWLFWHLKDCVAEVTSAEIQARLGFGKRLPKVFPYADHPDARRRAGKADPEHTEPNRRGNNPSSNVWLVVDAMARSGKDR